MENSRYIRGKEREKEMEKKLLKDTPMEWRIMIDVRTKSEMEEEKTAILQAMEKLSDSVSSFYPDIAVGRCFEECLDGSLRAYVRTSSKRFGICSTSDNGGVWKRFSQFLFRGTVREVKKLLTDMAWNGESVQKTTAAVSCIKQDPFGRYCCSATYSDGSNADYQAELYGSDQKRLNIFELGDALRATEKEHPGLPVVFAREGKVIQDCRLTCKVTELLDYSDSSEKNVFTSREEFRGFLEECFDGDQAQIQDELKKTEPYWVDVILVQSY